MRYFEFFTAKLFSVEIALPYYSQFTAKSCSVGSPCRIIYTVAGKTALPAFAVNQLYLYRRKHPPVIVLKFNDYKGQLENHFILPKKSHNSPF